MKKIKWKSIVFYSLIVLVFVAVVVWIFFPKDNSVASKKPGGLNMQLPGANVGRDTAKDKLSFYSAASQDSVKRAEALSMDPYRKDTVVKIIEKDLPAFHSRKVSSLNDPLEAKIKSIQARVYEPTTTEYPKEVSHKKIAEPVPDPEMEAINSTLDKIMAIQNPKTIVAATSPTNRPGYAVSSSDEGEATYFGKKTSNNPQQSFYGDANKKQAAPALTGIVPSEQIIMNGATVKMELGSAITVNGLRVPAGAAVFGIARIEGERVQVVIPSISYQNQILPVSLTVYDMDGLEGIYIPGSLSRDVVKESADNAIQSTGVAGYGLSIGTQAAAVGIGAAKSLLSKKVKQVRVTVTAGYKVLLRDNKQMGN